VETLNYGKHKKFQKRRKRHEEKNLFAVVRGCTRRRRGNHGKPNHTDPRAGKG
jgi:hypothetical protein